MKNVRLAFVGAGNMGQAAHLRHYADLPDCDVVALAELRPQLGQAVAQRFGIPHVYPNHKVLLDSETVDAIVAIQPFTLHGALLPDLLSAKVPILIEKPLARSPCVAQDVLRHAQEASVPLYVGFHKRSDLAIMAVRDVIASWTASGRFGSMTYLRVTMPPGHWDWGALATVLRTGEAVPTLAEDAPWDAGDRGRAFDAFVNYYIHQINLIRHLAGPYTIRYADPARRLLAFTSERGASGVLEMEPFTTTQDWQERVLVCFERAWIQVELPAPLEADRAGTVTIFRGADSEQPNTGSTFEQPVLPPIAAMRQQAIHFLRAVRGGATPLCQAAEASDDLRLAESYFHLLS